MIPRAAYQDPRAPCSSTARKIWTHSKMLTNALEHNDSNIWKLVAGSRIMILVYYLLSITNPGPGAELTAQGTVLPPPSPSKAGDHSFSVKPVRIHCCTIGGEPANACAVKIPVMVVVVGASGCIRDLVRIAERVLPNIVGISSYWCWGLLSKAGTLHIAVANTHRSPDPPVPDMCEE